MAHVIQQTISQVRRRARRLATLHAFGWTLAVVMAAAVVLGLTDYAIRFEDHGIRLMVSLALALVAAWAGYRFWYAGLGRRLGDVEIAHRVERRFPRLADRLASAVEFLKQPETDAGAGSAALRRAVIVQTASDLEAIDVAQVFDTRATRLALGVATVVGLLAVAVVVSSPSSARIGVARLLRPLGDDAWPRDYRVAFRETPTRIAAGQPFEVELVRDAGHRLPEVVRIHYRYESPGGTTEEEVEPMRRLNGTLVARQESVIRGFSYRAEGGDDTSMPWIPLEVVEPPRIESLEVALIPPAYSGLPPEASEKAVHALVGTHVELTGVSTKKLRHATIHAAREQNARGGGFRMTVLGFRWRPTPTTRWLSPNRDPIGSSWRTATG